MDQLISSYRSLSQAQTLTLREAVSNTGAPSSELDTTESTSAKLFGQENLQARTPTRPQRRAARHQHQLLQDLINEELI